jgi:hypothetical protein
MNMEIIQCPATLEVLTAVVMKSTVFWDIMPCSPLEVKDVWDEHIASTFWVK